MHVQTVQPAPWPATVIPILVFIVIMALRWRRMSQMRPLRLETLWILPTVYLGVAVALLVSHPPAPFGWLCLFLALVGGAAIGWQRGKLMRISIDPDTHRLSQQGSPAALLLLAGIFLVRQLARYEFSGAGAAALLASDVVLGLGFGLIAATRAEMAIRARRMLGEARLS